MAQEFQAPGGAKWTLAARLPVILTFEHQSGEGAPSRPGDRFNANAHGQTEYGARYGIWNILELLDSLSVRATFFMSGVTVEQYPESAKAAVTAGHEIAGMGYSFEKVRTARREKERSIIQKSKRVLSDICGVQIEGWRCPDYRMSPHTFDLLQNEGFRWDSSMLNDDVPYYFACEGGALVEIPFTTSTADKAYVAWPNPVRGGSPALADVWAKEFDVLYEESIRAPRFMILSLQTWATGRPVTLRTLKHFIERVKSMNDACFVSCGEFAEAFAGQSVSVPEVARNVE